MEQEKTKFWKPGKGIVGADTKKPSSASKSKIKNKKVLLSIGGVLVTLFLIVFVASYLFVFSPLQEVQKDVDALRRDGAQAKKAFQDRDLVLLEETFKQTEKDLDTLKETRDTRFSWAKNFPKIKDYYADTDYFINSGHYAIDAGREFVVLVTPFADAAGLKIEAGQAIEEKSFAEAFSDWIALMPKVANEIDPFLLKLSKVGDELGKVDASKYPEEFRGTAIRSTIVSAQSTLGQLNENAPDIKNALIYIPRVLAAGTPDKRYMIIMQNNAELRPTGGFWTFYATFRISNALLSSDFSSKDMYSIDLALDAVDAYYDFSVGLPDPLRKYLKVERWFARDANFSPDFPTSVTQFYKSYDLAAKISPVEIKTVDGIFAMDTQVLKELLEVTGPATVNGVTYTPDNVVLELEKIASLALREQQNRKKVLGDLMERMLVNVFESDKNLWSSLINKGINLADRKHIVAYLNDTEVQALVEKYNYGGRIVPVTGSDYLFAVSANLGGDKTSMFITRDITSSLTKEGNDWVKQVDVKFSYGPAEGEYAVFATTYRDWFRLYVPKGSQLLGIEGSEDTTGSADELDKTYFYGYLTLSPGGSKTLSFKYKLPAGVVGEKDYQLYIQKQSGINTEVYNVLVNGKSQTVTLDRDYKFKSAL